jgi:hypothetical protein
MSDFAYFEYADTSASYLIEVLISNAVTGQKREEREVKKLANDFVTLALRQDSGQIVGLRAISESEAQKRKKVSSAGTHFHGSTYLIRLGQGLSVSGCAIHR